MTRDEIGSYLGLKLETVSRLLSRLHREGVIQVQGRVIRMLDPVALKRLVETSAYSGPTSARRGRAGPSGPARTHGLAPEACMLAMVLRSPRSALDCRQVADPVAGAGQVLVRVHACGVCRTDLHVVDGELPDARFSVVPGHEIVGTVAALGAGRGGVCASASAWAFPGSPGRAASGAYCASGRENLCDAARFTGYTVDGGYAEFAVADARYCFPIPDGYSDEGRALAVRGLIGCRALGTAGDARRMGIYGFGAAAHIVAQVARYQGREVLAFTRPGDLAAPAFARRWAPCRPGSDQPAAEPLDAAILFAPVGALVPRRRATSRKAGSSSAAAST